MASGHASLPLWADRRSRNIYSAGDLEYSTFHHPTLITATHTLERGELEIVDGQIMQEEFGRPPESLAMEGIQRLRGTKSTPK